MQGLLRYRLKFMLLMAAVCQLNTQCSRKLLSDSSHTVEIQPHVNTGKENDSLYIRNQIETDVAQIKEKSFGDIINNDPDTGPDSTDYFADEIIETARKYLGIPHCMGGTTRKCMDCSGFVLTVYGTYGIDLPHNAQEQSKFGTKIERKDELRKGDLVFFSGSYQTKNSITHSGIYAGNNTFIHTSSGKGVTITSLNDPWWKNKFAFGTRILE